MTLFRTIQGGRYLRTEHYWDAIYGGRDYRYLLSYRMTRTFCGIALWSWWHDVREVPVWEWARCAVGDGIGDTPPQSRTP